MSFKKCVIKLKSKKSRKKNVILLIQDGCLQAIEEAWLDIGPDFESDNTDVDKE